MSNNLPMQVKKGFLNISKEQKKKVGRFFKAIGYAGLFTASFGVMWVAGPSLISLLSLPALGAGTIGVAKNSIINTSPDSLFGIRQGRNVAHIEQVSVGVDQIKLKSKINEMLKNEKSSTIKRYKKGGLMALQTLIMLEKEKNLLKKNPKAKNENGLYSKNYQTITHGINIDNMKLLEELGYIKIESDEVKKESYLILERLGFGQGKEVGKVIKALLTRNKEEKKSLKREMHTLKFKVTDKSIDIEELYNLYNKDKKRMKRFQAIFGKNGVLATENIDVIKDEDGVSTISYDAPKSFVQRITEEQKAKKKSKEFKDAIDVKDTLTYQKQNEYIKKINNQQRSSDEHQKDSTERI